MKLSNYTQMDKKLSESLRIGFSVVSFQLSVVNCQCVDSNHNTIIFKFN